VNQALSSPVLIDPDPPAPFGGPASPDRRGRLRLIGVAGFA
jgi:hypothetical protein